MCVYTFSFHREHGYLKKEERRKEKKACAQMLMSSVLEKR
jgi:hypothetical protein